ncbi:MAG: enoyl-CoA hydratase-related protein [Sphingorhabdus sp.]
MADTATADEDVLIALEDGVLSIVLNDEAGRNVLSVRLMRAIMSAIEDAATDPDVRIILVSNVGKIFCAGADLKAAPSESSAQLFSDLLLAILRSPRPTVARITGHAMGGGVGLAAAFDISIASEECKMGFTEVRLGVVPAVISAVCLPKMRRGEALDAFLRGNRFDAVRAAELGLITRAVAADAIDAEIASILADLRLGGPAALAIAKQIIATVPGMPTEEAIAKMANLSAEVFASPEARAGTDAFKERRLPPWAS